jgi:hypothetical protein
MGWMSEGTSSPRSSETSSILSSHLLCTVSLRRLGIMSYLITVMYPYSPSAQYDTAQHRSHHSSGQVGMPRVFLNGACSVTLPYFVPTSFLLFPDYWVFMLSLLPRSLVLMRLDPFSGIRPRLASAMRTTEWDPESISGLPPPWARVQV